MSTTELIKGSEYFEGIQSFFGNFPDAYGQVQSQILKIETRQEYDESGNPSFDKLIEKKYSDSLNLVPAVRKDDVPLYENLKKRSVEFIRCRPIVKPLTDYLKWEIHCYDFNSKHGENILFFEAGEAMNKIEHDFMVFDHAIAFIHDYNKSGLIKGGWKIIEQAKIDQLICLYSIVKSRSINYKNYIENHQLNYSF